MPLLENPDAPSLKPAFSHRQDEETVRDDRWRMIVQGSAASGNILGIELFDFNDSVEGIRVDPDDHPEVVERLLNALKTQFGS